uniref:Pentacotripeptide-repeat region of PRORP domain-containing protein n=1 Tax=Salix viminalis TaxID=40686 RepID=A0A6N2MIX4_SALVM
MKLQRCHPHRLFLKPILTFHTKPKHLYCTSVIRDSDDKDSQFIVTLKNIVRGKQSWIIAFNDPFISNKLKPHHVEKVLLALRFFNFLGLHKNFNHSTMSFCILIHALANANLFWPASSLLQTLLLRGGLDPREVFEALHDCFKKCDFISSLGFDLLIQSYLQEKRMLMRQCELLPRVRTLGEVLNGLVKIRRVDMVYNVLIHGLCKNKRVWEAVEIKNGLIQKGLTASEVTYCTLVLGLCKVQEFEVGSGVIDEMIELGFVPTEAALSSLVEGLRRKGKVVDAFGLVTRVQKVGVMPSLFVYNALINSLCKDGKFDEAELLFKEMGEKGLCANDVTYSILIDSFCRRGELDNAIQFVAGIKITVYPYNSLINGHCKLGNLSAAVSCFDEMIDKGLKPTVVSYTSLISGYCNKGKLHEAFRLYHEMTGKGIAANTYTFTTLISALCRANRMSDAIRLFNEMLDQNIMPNEDTVRKETALFYMVIAKKEIERYRWGVCREMAFGLLKNLHDQRLRPDKVIYTSMIDGYSKAGSVEKAFRIWDIMMMKDVLQMEGSMEKAVQLHNEMLKGLLANTVSYNILVRGFCKLGRVEEATKLLDEMIDMLFFFLTALPTPHYENWEKLLNSEMTDKKGREPNQATHSALTHKFQGVFFFY